MPVIPQPKARVEYKKPARLNVVSVSLALFVALCGYVGYGLWPVFAMRSIVKSELADALPDLWRINLRDERSRGTETARIKKALVTKIRQRGMTDPNLEVRMNRTSKTVAIEARYTMRVHYAGIDKTFVIPSSPRVETDASRVEW